MTKRTVLKRSRDSEASASSRYRKYLKSGFINMSCIGMIPVKYTDKKVKQEFIELYELPSPDNCYCVGAWYTGGKYDTQIWPIGWLHRNKKQMLPPPDVTREQVYNHGVVLRKKLISKTKTISRRELIR